MTFDRGWLAIGAAVIASFIFAAVFLRLAYEVGPS